MKRLVIAGTAVVSLGLTGTGLAGMVLRDVWLGTGYEWSTLLWIVGLVGFFLIPLEICLMKSRKRR